MFEFGKKCLRKTKKWSSILFFVEIGTTNETKLMNYILFILQFFGKSQPDYTPIVSESGRNRVGSWVGFGFPIIPVESGSRWKSLEYIENNSPWALSAKHIWCASFHVSQFSVFRFFKFWIVLSKLCPYFDDITHHVCNIQDSLCTQYT